MGSGEPILRTFRDSISDPIGEGIEPVFTKEEFIAVDGTKLPEGSVIYDNNPPGHVSVDSTKATYTDIIFALLGVFKFPK